MATHRSGIIEFSLFVGCEKIYIYAIGYLGQRQLLIFIKVFDVAVPDWLEQLEKIL